MELPRYEDQWQEWVSSRIRTGQEALFGVVDGAGGWVGIVGASVDRRRSEVAHVFTMYVAPEHRGVAAGVGALLMEAAVEWARGTDASVVRLDAHEENKRALAFYRRLGWVETGKLTPFRGDPSVMLVEMAYGAFR